MKYLLLTLFCWLGCNCTQKPVMPWNKVDWWKYETSIPVDGWEWQNDTLKIYAGDSLFMVKPMSKEKSKALHDILFSH